MNRNYFITIVAGDDYKSLMEKYNKNTKCEGTIVFKYADAERIKKIYVSTHEQMLKDETLTNDEKVILESELNLAKSQSAEDFFNDLTYDYDHDENGNAITDKNIYGKYSSYAVGQFFSVPFTLNNGETSFSAKKSEIDWSKMHLNNIHIYESAWDMVMGNKKPKTEEDKIIYENMKNRTLYFENFGNRDTYVASNTAFWGYAFLSEETGWMDMEDNEQFTWMTQFYDMFIKTLPDDTTLTIIECRK